MRTASLSILLLACLSLFFVRPAVAAEDRTSSALESDATGWTELQPASGLTNWTRIGIPPTHPLGRAQWHAEPGVLVCDGDGGHEMLRYDGELGDCIFHVEFAFTPVTGTNRNYNSGVFIRNSADGSVWYQAQLAMDGGYLFGYGPVDGKGKRFKLAPAELRMRPAGQWNTIEVSAHGHELTVWLNGAITCRYTQCEQPRGYIALESEGYRIQFRNLKLKRL